MRQLLMLAAVAGLALARPEMYREKEDFKFSRSSTDEGSKSGYYDAQRGNMGGNYEKAHNMDPLAQNQMSGLVRTVEGELGDGAKQTSGNVFSSANSRGVYGSGNYDLRNLQGRNFQEGETLGSQSHSSLTSHHGSGYTGQYSTSNTGYGSSLTHDSRLGGYSSAGNSEQNLYNNRHHQASDSLQSASQYDRNSAQNSGHTALNSGYYSQAAGYQGQVYDQGRSLTQTSDGYGSDIHSRLVSGKPVRIIIRPGTKVIVPVAAQTYDASQSASSFDQNAINSETEVLNSNDQFAVVTPKTKHYESSYSYRKEWEKHNTQPASGVVPLALPTVNPYSANSELYEDVQRQTGQHRQSASEIASQTQHSSHHSGYNVNSASSSQQTQADYNARLHSTGANTGSSAYQGAYNGGSNSAYNLDTNANNRRLTSGAYVGTNTGAASLNQIEDSNTKPKSYQSSYSYHKSWERQGDPYIIQPSSNGVYNGEASGKLTAASLNQGYGTSQQYGSHHQSHQSYSSNADCDEHGHIRVARSPHSHHHHQAQTTRGDVVGQEDLGQQVQQQWGDIEQFGQQTQTQWDQIEDLGQQTQNTWDQIGQQTETKWDKLKDEGQQTQKVWGQQETQKKSDKIEDFGQESQNQWDQQDIGQQTQIDWVQQDTQRQTELGQQTQDTWTTLETKPIENPASQAEQQTSGFDSSSQHNHGMNHQSDKNTFEIAQTSNDQKMNTDLQTLETNKSSNHHAHNIWNDIKREEIGQENEDTVEDLTQTTDLNHQMHTMWGGINVNDNSFQNQETGNAEVSSSTNTDPISNTFLNMPNPHPWMYNQVHHHHENRSNSFAHSASSSSFSESQSHSWQQQHSTSMNSNSFNSNSQTQSNGSTFGTSLMSLWDKLDNIEKQTIPSKGNDDHYVGQQGTANVFDTHQVQHSVFDSHNTDKQIDGIVSTAQHDVPVSHVTNKPLQPNTASVTTTQPSTVTTYKIQTHDIGRGDIESDETPSEQIKPDNSKSYKTPEEIEILSLAKETNKVSMHDVLQENKNKEDERDLNVMSLDQQAHSENQDKEQSSQQSGASITTSNTQSTNDMPQNTNTYNIDEKTSLDMEQQFKNKAHPDYHNHNSFVNSQENQQNTDQHSVDFEQQSENLGAQQMEQFESQNIGQIDSFQQENKKLEVEELGQKNEQFDQVSLSGWKPDENFEQQEHKLENWGQINENMEQQSQSGWTDNMENQQIQTGWMPTEDLQQHSQLTDTFEQPMENLNQQVQPAWKPADFEQHSQLTEPFEQSKENLDQQVQTVWKPAEDLQNSQVPDVFAQVDQIKENRPAKDNQPEVVEELIVPKKVSVVNSATEVELVTEKPGFWKSVGSKFTSAKDKVSSWFSS